MKRLWTLPELIDHWTLAPAERALVDEAHEPHTRLGCACLLKYFQLDWRFPRSRADVPVAAVAPAYLRESLGLRRAISDRLGIAECLEGLATVAVGQHQPERATRLLGAAEALRQAIGAPLPPVERLAFEATMQAARAPLGEQAFATAWAAGRALPLEHVIDEALADVAATGTSGIAHQSGASML